MLDIRSALLGIAASVAILNGAWAETVVTDATGAEVIITDSSRIVALGGDVSEIIFALGAGDGVVANDTTSVYPPEAAALPKVGYVRAVAAEGLLSMAPSLIIANNDAGPPTVLEQVEGIGVPVVRLADATSAADIPENIMLIGAALSLDEEAEILAADVSRRLEEVSVTDIADEDRVPVLFVLNAANGAPMAAGTATRADEIIRLAGGRNVFAAHEGYRPFSPEAAIAAAPELIIMMSHTYNALGGLEGLEAHPALAMTPAVQQGRVLAMDGLLLLGFGPRTPDAIAQVRDAIEQLVIAN